MMAGGLDCAATYRAIPPRATAPLSAARRSPRPSCWTASVSSMSSQSICPSASRPSVPCRRARAAIATLFEYSGDAIVVHDGCDGAVRESQGSRRSSGSRTGPMSPASPLYGLRASGLRAGGRTSAFLAIGRPAQDKPSELELLRADGSDWYAEAFSVDAADSRRDRRPDDASRPDRAQARRSGARRLPGAARGAAGGTHRESRARAPSNSTRSPPS